MKQPSVPLVDPTFLFRFRCPLRRISKPWTADGIELPPLAKLPCFGEIAGKRLFADVRGGWDKSGFSFTVKVTGKRQPPWSRESRPEDSDGLHIWIDTRDTHNIHRASRFCHRFVFSPQGSGKAGLQPFGQMLPIHRAKEDPRTLGPQQFGLTAQVKMQSYELAAHIPAEALTGFNPEENPQLGFFYAVVDRELGWQTWNLGPEFPITEDPSLWGTVTLEP